MKIQDYIRELLIKNQGVIIPGFGGFVSEYEPSVFDVTENKFLPPAKKILFKKEYSYTDNLLIDYISEKENITKEESAEELKNFIERLQKSLGNGEKIAINGVGELGKNSKGEIFFEQDKESNLLADSFGLKAIKTKPIQQPKKEIKHAPVVKKKTNKKVVYLSAIVVVLIGITGITWLLSDGFSNFNFITGNDDKVAHTENHIDIRNTQMYLDSIARADSIKAMINQSIDETTNKKDALFYQEPKKEEPKSKYSNFYIIAGSFKKMENAEKFASGLKSKGYSTEIIQSGENLYRISIAHFSDETSALKELYKLREKPDIKSVWILKSI